MCSFVESCLLRLILDSADSAMGVDKGGQEADTVRGSVEKREKKDFSKTARQDKKFSKTARQDKQNSQKLQDKIRGDRRQIQ